MLNIGKRLILGLALIAAGNSDAAAQLIQIPDSARLHQLSALVVTVERVSIPVRATIGAVTRLTANELQRRPARTIADALQQAPGIAFVDFEGSGTDPQIITRGFYGGGEAEYMLVLLDGKPLNSVENGRVNWDMVPLAAVQSIEVLRGPGSTVWGDAAMGGVINLITRSGGGWNASVSGGEVGVLRASATGGFDLAGHSSSITGGFNRSRGFRDHAARTIGTFSATFGIDSTSTRGLALSTENDVRQYEEPGPLTTDELASARDRSARYYRFDESDERWHRLTLAGHTRTSDRNEVRGSLTGEYRDLERVRTVRLAPDFADTKERELTTSRVLGTVEYRITPFLRKADLLVGADASYGGIESGYFNIAQGDEQAYAGSDGSRGSPSADTRGNRLAAGAFGRYALHFVPALTITVGARYDWLRDAFEIDDTGEQEVDNSAFTVRAGANFRYAHSLNHEGNLYWSLAETFKAPTPDQLYDQRRIPVPFDPFEISFSNDSLKSQKGTNYEVGLYHSAAIKPYRWSLDVTLAAYQLDLEDEIDFNIATLSYGNIGKSQHRGIEAGLQLRGPGATAVFGNYTMQAARRKGGDIDGFYLKAIPRHTLVGGVSAGSLTGLQGTLSATHSAKTFLDDANTLELSDWTRIDARFTYTLGRNQLFLDVLNLADKEYNTTGFPDQSGAAVYYYPAVGRTLQAGVRLR